jgi:hypothetical protein
MFVTVAVEGDLDEAVLRRLLRALGVGVSKAYTANGQGEAEEWD